jgi:predicted dienelactone hydrolase
MFRLLLVLSLGFFLTRPAAAQTVGFRELEVPDGQDRPLRVGIWYPSKALAAPTALGTFTQEVAANGPVTGRRLPLVVMSHGTGGWYGGHYDTAIALAKVGFVAAAVSHTGDTWDDHSRSVHISGRPAHIRRLIDYMLSQWDGRDRLDPSRIGVFGFSAGGFTALVVAGGTPDLSKTAAYCVSHPTRFECTLLKGAPPPPSSPQDWVHDPRIKAAVVAAPALGYTFGREGLAGVTIPVQLWRAEYDHILPHPDYAEAVRIALPRPPEHHLVVNGDHFDFLAPCDPKLAALQTEICASRPGFDRVAFHNAFNAEVVRFFQTTLTGEGGR